MYCCQKLFPLVLKTFVESGADSDWSIESANDYRYYLTLEGLQYASGRYNEVEMSVEFNNTSWELNIMIVIMVNLD